MDTIEGEILVPTVDAPSLRRRHRVPRRPLRWHHAGPRWPWASSSSTAASATPSASRSWPAARAISLSSSSRPARNALDIVDVGMGTCSASCCGVLASEGYPEKPKTGVPIYGIQQADAMPNVRRSTIARTRMGPDGQVVTAGGRVLSAHRLERPSRWPRPASVHTARAKSSATRAKRSEKTSA